FFNRFQGLLRIAPLMFPLACPESRFAPVYVGDVAKAFAKALSDKTSFGKRYELCGSQQFTLRELVQYTARHSGLKRKIIGLGNMASRLQARVLGLVPGKPFSLDNYYSLQHPSVCTDPGLERLGITPTPIDAIVPMYLGNRRTRARYSDWRRYAGRG
ncbi:MAG: complex I NDUFA9 subunit family protein, partial [Gammaproteobacteria bacterium]